MLSLLSDIDQLKARLDAVCHLDNYRIQQALELEYTYESNRIEGNTLTLRETDLVINEGLTIGGKPLKDHLEAINHRDALDYVRDIVQQRLDFSQRVLLDLHSLILRGIDRDNAGRYRSVPVLIGGSKHRSDAPVPPQPYLVPVQMEALFHWYESEAAGLHPVVPAAELHERIVTIHPFIDGTVRRSGGRTARLVMNLTLLQHGFPLAILKGDANSRLTYYNALENAQTTGDKTGFIKLVADTVRLTLERLLSVLQGSQGSRPLNFVFHQLYSLSIIPTDPLMSEHDKERLDRLEMKLTDLMIKVDRHEELLQDLTARVSRQDQLLSRLLNLLGLMLPALEAEDGTPPTSHSLLLLMRRALN